MLRKLWLLGAVSALTLVGCQQAVEPVDDQGGFAPVISSFTATQQGVGYFELGWRISDRENETMTCAIEVDNPATQVADWLDVGNPGNEGLLEPFLWMSSFSINETDISDISNFEEGLQLEGLLVANPISPCTSLNKAFVAFKRPGSYNLRLKVQDTLGTVKTSYRTTTVRVNNQRPYIAAFGVGLETAPTSLGPVAQNGDPIEFPLTVELQWLVGDPLGIGGNGELKCRLDLNGDNIFETSVPGNCALQAGYTHTFTKAGNYNVRLQVSDQLGLTFIATTRVGLQPNNPPVIGGFAGASEFLAPILFDELFFFPFSGAQAPAAAAQASNQVQPQVYNPEAQGFVGYFLWQIYDTESFEDGLNCFLDPEGDGSFQVSIPGCYTDPEDWPIAIDSAQKLAANKVTPANGFGVPGTFFVYPKLGQYFPRLRVVDAQGFATESNIQIQFDPDVQAYFNELVPAVILPGFPPLAVLFVDTSDNITFEVDWDFYGLSFVGPTLTCTFDYDIDDGNPAVAVPCDDSDTSLDEVTYPGPGIYTARFTVNDGSNTATAESTVTFPD